MRDTAPARWTAAETYRCLNEALLLWGHKATMARLYTVSGGWVAGDFDYDLPVYMRGAIRPQQRRIRDRFIELPVSDATTYTWVDVGGWEIEPNATGGSTLRLTAPYSVEGRIIWFGPNGAVPVTVPTITTANIDSDDTSVILSAAVDVEDSGIVKIDSEYIAYSGVTRGTSTTTLSNLVRALYASTAATHTTTTSVYWCVGAGDLRFFSGLYDQIRANLHQMFLTNGAESEKRIHEKMMVKLEQAANQKMSMIAPEHPAPRMRLMEHYR